MTVGMILRVWCWFAPTAGSLQQGILLFGSSISLLLVLLPTTSGQGYNFTPIQRQRDIGCHVCRRRKSEPRCRCRADRPAASSHYSPTGKYWQQASLGAGSSRHRLRDSVYRAVQRRREPRHFIQRERFYQGECRKVGRGSGMGRYAAAEFSPQTHYTISRYNSDGSIDTSFDGDGRVNGVGSEGVPGFPARWKTPDFRLGNVITRFTASSGALTPRSRRRRQSVRSPSRVVDLKAAAGWKDHSRWQLKQQTLLISRLNAMAALDTAFDSDGDDNYRHRRLRSYLLCDRYSSRRQDRCCRQIELLQPPLASK